MKQLIKCKTTIYVLTDNEHCVRLDSISQMPLQEEEIEYMKYEKIHLDGEIAIMIKPPETPRDLKKFIELVHPDLTWLGWWTSRYGSNNWRKLHGLPKMQRKLFKNSITRKDENSYIG